MVVASVLHLQPSQAKSIDGLGLGMALPGRREPRRPTRRPTGRRPEPRAGRVRPPGPVPGRTDSRLRGSGSNPGDMSTAVTSLTVRCTYCSREVTRDAGFWEDRFAFPGGALSLDTVHALYGASLLFRRGLPSTTGSRVAENSRPRPSSAVDPDPAVRRSAGTAARLGAGRAIRTPLLPGVRSITGCRPRLERTSFRRNRGRPTPRGRAASTRPRRREATGSGRGTR